MPDTYTAKDLPALGLDPGMYYPGPPGLVRAAKSSWSAHKAQITRNVKNATDLCTNVEKLIREAQAAGTVISRTAHRENVKAIQDALTKLDDSLHKADSSGIRFMCIAGLDETDTPEDYAEWSSQMEASAKKGRDQQAELRSTLSKIPDEPTPPPTTPSSTNQPQAGKAKPNEALKPDELDLKASPAEVARWIQSFTTYYTSSKFDRASLNEQREYLRRCLSSELQDLVFERASQSTPVDPSDDHGFMRLIEEEFEDAEPLLNRRLSYFAMQQKTGETYDLFLARLSKQERLASLDDITPDDIKVILRISGCRDKSLKEEILKLDTCTVPAINKVARKVKLIKAKMGTEDESVNRIDTQPPPCPCCADPRPVSRRPGIYLPFCNKCFREEKYRGLKCKKCPSEGNHSTKACKGKKVELPRKQQQPHTSRQNRQRTQGNKSPSRRSSGDRGPTRFSKKNKDFKESREKYRDSDKESEDEAVNCVETDDDEIQINAVNIRYLEDLVDEAERTDAGSVNSITVEERVNSVSQEETLDNMMVKASSNSTDAKIFRIYTCPDTGCRRTLCGEDIAKKMNLTVKQSEQVRLKAANRSGMDYVGTGDMKLRFVGQTVVTKVIVTKSLQGRLLVGRRDLKSLGVIHPNFPCTLPTNTIKNF